PIAATPVALPARRDTPRWRRSRRESDPSGLEQADVAGDVPRRDREEVGGALVAPDDDVEDEAVEDVGLRAADADLVCAPHGPQGRGRAEDPMPRSVPAALDDEVPGAGGGVGPRVDAHDHELRTQAGRKPPGDRGEHPSFDRTRAVTARVEER